MVYVLENPTDEEIKRGHAQWGFNGQKVPFRHNGINLEAYKNVDAMDNSYISAHVRDRKPHLFLQRIMPRTVEDASKILFNLIPIDAVDYWAIIDPLRGTSASMIVGLRHQVSVNSLDGNILYEMVRVPEDDAAEFNHLPYQTPPNFLMEGEAKNLARPARNPVRGWNTRPTPVSSMTDNEDILKRLAEVERGLAEQQSQTLVVRSAISNQQTAMTQESALRQHLQSAYHAIKSKFDQVEERQLAMETKTSQEFLQLQRQMSECQGFGPLLHVILGEIQGLKKQRNDRQDMDTENEL